MGEMNSKRSEWAHAALLVFADETGQTLDEEEDWDYEILKDLLCDLMHWADEHLQPGEFGDAFESAELLHQGEVDDDE